MGRVSLLMKVFERSADDSRRLLASSEDDVSLFPDEGEYKPPPGLVNYGFPDPAEEDRSDDFRSVSSRSDRSVGSQASASKKSFLKKATSTSLLGTDISFADEEDQVKVKETKKSRSPDKPSGRKTTRRASIQETNSGAFSPKDTNHKTAKSSNSGVSSPKDSSKKTADSHVSAKSSSEGRSVSRRQSRKKERPSSKSELKDETTNSKPQQEASSSKRDEDAHSKSSVPKRGLTRHGSVNNINSKKDKGKGVDSPVITEKERKRSMRRSSMGNIPESSIDVSADGCLDLHSKSMKKHSHRSNSKLSSSSSHGKSLSSSSHQCKSLGSSSHGSKSLNASCHSKLSGSSHAASALGTSSDSRRNVRDRESNRSVSRRKSSTAIKGLESARTSKRSRDLSSSEHLSNLSPPSDGEGDDIVNTSSGRRQARSTGRFRSDRRIPLDDDDDDSFAG